MLAGITARTSEPPLCSCGLPGVEHVHVGTHHTPGGRAMREYAWLCAPCLRCAKEEREVVRRG